MHFTFFPGQRTSLLSWECGMYSRWKQRMLVHQSILRLPGDFQN